MTTVYVFARLPVRGRVKTRLAAGIGEQAALDFYVATLRRTVAVLDDPRWRTVLAVTPDDSRDSPLYPPGPDRVTQGDGDLGQRMRRCLDGAPALVVGSDIPGLTAAHVAGAIATLSNADVVLGPAEDGGFWLVGCRTPPPPAIFDNVRWSTGHALADTVANLGACRVGYAVTLWDVDDVDAYRRWRRGGAPSLPAG